MAEDCIFCGIIEGKVASAKIYEDEHVLAVLDIMPATKGHVLVIPKKHVMFSSMMDDELSGHVFKVANKLSGMLVDTLGPNGTNIVVSNGGIAGQKVNHTSIQVIPRYENDGVLVSWENKHVTEDELKDTFAKLVDKTKDIKFEVVKEAPKIEEELEEIKEELEEEDFDDERLP
jgi:histidine triad (HIT) family protein